MAYGNNAPAGRGSFKLDDYVDVAARIKAWYEAYPDGRIETTMMHLDDKGVSFRALAYRGLGNDEQPAGTGHSFLAIPGSTPYTRGSEVENCETSAVGRALVMAGLPAKKVASSEEIASKGGVAKSEPKPAAKKQSDEALVAAALEIFNDEEDPAILDWVASINSASSSAELLAIGKDIASSNLAGERLQALQKAYKARKDALDAANG